jgi:DNA-binding transcriptional MerR regulator
VLKVVKRLLDTGVSLHQIRSAVTHLRERGVDDLAQITLMSDGASVYECTSADEVIDLVQGGQGVFGIAVGRVWREVEGELASLPSERPADREPGQTAMVLAEDGEGYQHSWRVGLDELLSTWADSLLAAVHWLPDAHDWVTDPFARQALPRAELLD